MNYKIPISVLLLLLSICLGYGQNITKEKGVYRFQGNTYSPSTISEILESNSASRSYYDQYKLKKQYARDGYIAGTTFMIIGAGYAIYKRKMECNGGPCIFNGILGLGVGLIGVVMNLFAISNEAKSYKKLNKAIDVFNGNLKESTSLESIRPKSNFTQKNIGLVYNF